MVMASSTDKSKPAYLFPTCIIESGCFDLSCSNDPCTVYWPGGVKRSFGKHFVRENGTCGRVKVTVARGKDIDDEDLLFFLLDRIAQEES